MPRGSQNQTAAVAVGAILAFVTVDAAEWLQARVVVGHDAKVGSWPATIGVTDIDRLAQIAERSNNSVARILFDIAKLAVIAVTLVIAAA